LQNNLNRWYDPTVGRWVSEDPIGFAGGDTNVIRYVHNSPMLYSDPFGLAAFTKPQRDLYQLIVLSESFANLLETHPELANKLLDAFVDAIDKLDANLAEALLKEIDTIYVYPDRGTLRDGIMRNSGKLLSEPGLVGAFDGTLHRFYCAADGDKAVTIQTILHEFAHALDKITGDTRKYSTGALWLIIWAAEIKGDELAKDTLKEELAKKDKNAMLIELLWSAAHPLNPYACENSVEGFAEFFQYALLHPDEAKKRFPRAFAFMVENGLLPK
jgi:hypothetical protein